MTKSAKLILALTLTALLTAGCTTIQPTAINSVDITGTDFTQEMKKGQACENYVLFFGPFGTRDIGHAARKADIKEIKLVDYSNHFYLLFAQNCVNIRGL